MQKKSVELQPRENSYGLIFGINSWLALGLEVILTITVADSAGLNLGPRDQFYVYGGYFLAVGLLFVIYHFATRIFLMGRSAGKYNLT